MKTRQRTTITIIGLLTSFLMTGTTLVPAQAEAANQPPPDQLTANQLSASRRGAEDVVPLGNGGSTSTRDGNHNGSTTRLPGPTATPSLTAAPTTSPPPVSRFWIPFGTDYTCEPGYACAEEGYGNGYYIFKFYYYGTYALSNWIGGGYLKNRQTGGAAVRTLDRNGGEIFCYWPSQGMFNVDWTPVWYIRLTPSGC